jgi:two-component sensor histidine kinase
LDPLKISFFNLTIDLIQNVLNQKQEKSDRDIKHYIDTIWHFLALVSQIDIGKIQKDPEKKETIFNKVLIELKNKDIEKKKFSETLSQFFKNEDFSLENFLIPSSQFSYYINEIYSDLKQNISIKNIELIRRSEKDLIDSSFLELLGLLFKEDQGPWGSYIIRINVLQLMASYTEREAGNVEKVSKPEVVEILSKNFNLFKEVIGSLNLNKNKQEVLDFEQRFNALFEQPVKYSFKKFFPVIQEMSEVMNKKVNFTLKGDQGSLDKDKLTLLNDSIVHILRNALDHGIEQPDQRISIGKEEIGHIEIKCTEEKNEYLEIVIKDDGKGISGDFILKNALEKGLLMEKQSLSLNNKEKINLIFLPNFSTKKTISQISGRGIGLDIVKHNLEKVGAQLSIDSKVGQGTTITIKIPKNFQINSKVS